MATNSRHMQIVEPFLVSFVRICTEFNQFLDHTICSVLNCQGHQSVITTLVTFVKDINPARILSSLIKEVHYVDVIFDDSVVDWQEAFIVKFVLGAVLKQNAHDKFVSG